MDLRSKLRTRVPQFPPSEVCAIVGLTKGRRVTTPCASSLMPYTNSTKCCTTNSCLFPTVGSIDCTRRASSWVQSTKGFESLLGSQTDVTGTLHPKRTRYLALPVPRPRDQSEGRPELRRRSTDWHRHEHLETLDLRALQKEGSSKRSRQAHCRIALAVCTSHWLMNGAPRDGRVKNFLSFKENPSELSSCTGVSVLA